MSLQTEITYQPVEQCNVKKTRSAGRRLPGIRIWQKNKKGANFHSFLAGQEEERCRISKELHDGLGSLLTSVKYSLQKLGTDIQRGNESNPAYERTFQILSQSISELRRITQDMMPAGLQQFGLDETLRDYCNKINTFGELHVTYQSFQMNTKWDKSIEINIYRIIQELLHNIQKHANASQALVQIMLASNRLTITVEDNGKGFDYYNLHSQQSSGLVNISDRVDYLKGHMNIQTGRGNGTSVFIEINTLNL